MERKRNILSFDDFIELSDEELSELPIYKNKEEDEKSEEDITDETEVSNDDMGLLGDGSEEEGSEESEEGSEELDLDMDSEEGAEEGSEEDAEMEDAEESEEGSEEGSEELDLDFGSEEGSEEESEEEEEGKPVKKKKAKEIEDLDAE